jgi:hypothetical protein
VKKIGTHPIFWNERREYGIRPLMLTEFGGKGDGISRDGLGDGVTRRWSDGENYRFQGVRSSWKRF